MYDYKAKMDNKKTQLKFNSRNIGRILRFFGLKDVVVMEDDLGKEKGMVNMDEKNKVYVNKKMGNVNKVLTLVHELIHSGWGLDHNLLGWYCGFYSTKHDRLSETIASIIFRKKLVWEEGG